MNKNIGGYLSLIACLLLIFGCKKFDEDITFSKYEAEYAVPILSNASISVQDIWTNNDSTDLIIGEDGLLTFVYTGDVVTRDAQSILGTIPTDFPIFITDTVTSFDLGGSLPNNINIDKGIIKSGTLNFIIGAYSQSTPVRLIIPELVKEGVPLEINSNYTVSELFAEEVDLAGYELLLENDSLTVIAYAISYNSEGNEIHTYLQILGNPVAAANFTAVEFSYVEGYLGYEVVEFERDTIEIDIYNEGFLAGDLEFLDPRVILQLRSSFGFPARTDIQVMRTESRNGEFFDLESEVITNGFDFNYPRLDEVGQYKETNFPLDKDNSNIVNIFNSQPIALDYHVNAVVNPDQDTTIIGFLTDSSEFQANVIVEVPLYGRASNFVGENTYEADFSDLNNVTYAEFKAIIQNQLPVEVGVQVYFKEDDTILDSLYEEVPILIEGAPVDSDGNVNGIGEKISFIDVGREKMARIKSTNKIQLKGIFFTSNTGSVPVKVLSDQELQFQMGMKVGIEE